jgi:hypothetical protein
VADPQTLILPNGAAGAAARSGVDNLQPRTLTAVPPSREVPQTSQLQAQSEGAAVEVQDDRIEFMGEWFRLAEEIGMMPLLAFSHAAQQGADSEDMSSLAAMYALIRDTIDQSRPVVQDENGQPTFEADGVTPKWAGPSEWMRFERHAIDVKAGGEDLMELISRAMKVISSRPPKRRGDSSTTSPPSSGSTRDGSPSPAHGGRTVPGIEDLRPVADFGQPGR